MSWPCHTVSSRKGSPVQTCLQEDKTINIILCNLNLRPNITCNLNIKYNKYAEAFTALLLSNFMQRLLKNVKFQRVQAYPHLQLISVFIVGNLWITAHRYYPVSATAWIKQET